MQKLEGLVAATDTPFDRNGDLNLSAIEPIVDDLIESRIEGQCVCRSTGEGMSLSVRMIHDWSQLPSIASDS